MAAALIRQLLPYHVKHPALAIARWYYQVLSLPAQSRTDRSILKQILLHFGGQKIKVFEWGAGASTIYYTKFLRERGLKFHWHAQDNSRAWHQKIQDKITEAGLAKNVEVYCSEFPAFFELHSYTYDTPIPSNDYINSVEAQEYVSRPKELGCEFDLLFIDGRFRRRCLDLAAEVVSPNGIVVLHDADRTHYHSGLDRYPKVQFLETGMVPGISQPSTMALAAPASSTIFTEITEQYRDSWVSEK